MIMSFETARLPDNTVPITSAWFTFHSDLDLAVENLQRVGFHSKRHRSRRLDRHAMCSELGTATSVCMHDFAFDLLLFCSCSSLGLNFFFESKTTLSGGSFRSDPVSINRKS